MDLAAERKRWRDSMTELMRVASTTGWDQGYIEELIALGEDVNARDCYGRTALMLAARSAMTENVTVLLNAGSDPLARDAEGWTAMDHAVAFSYGGERRRETSAVLARAGLREDDAWRGRAVAAAVGSDAGALQQIVGAHPAEVHSVRDPLLFWAAKAGAVECVRLLLKAGADVNQVALGGTPLIAAAREGHLEVCRTLVDAGADLFICVDGYTARGWATTDAHLPAQRAVAKYLAEQEKLSKRPSSFVKAKGLENAELQGPFLLVKADAVAVATALGSIAGLTRHQPQVLGRSFAVGGRGYLLLQFKSHAWTAIYPMTMASIGDPWSEYAQQLSAQLATSVIDYCQDEEAGSFCFLYESGKQTEGVSASGTPEDNTRVTKYANKLLKAQKAYLHAIEPCRWPSMTDMELLLPSVTLRDVSACDWVSDEQVPSGRFTIPV